MPRPIEVGEDGALYVDDPEHGLLRYADGQGAPEPLLSRLRLSRRPLAR